MAYENPPTCDVFQCFSRDHTREEHQCVRCKIKGHGHRECPKKNYGLELKNQLIPGDMVQKLKDRKETGTIFDKMYVHAISHGEFCYGPLDDGDSYFIRNTGGFLQVIIITSKQNEILQRKNLRYTDVHLLRHFANRYIKA
uniref:Uncharacterized protein n=1 Tax=viral metagenome TaxID=1070528 RepID=A0A6C0AC56_9ZZZZ